MPKYIFAYHGGGKPDTPEEGAKVMAAWEAWLGGMGDACVDMGAPVGLSKTVSADGVAENGCAHPLSGYTTVAAADVAAAHELARGCTILDGRPGPHDRAHTLEM